MAVKSKAHRFHRIIALALLVVMLSSGYMLIDQFVIGRYKFYQDNISQLQDRLQRYENMLSMREDLEERLQQIKQDNSIDVYYLQQSSSVLAAADLQQQVKSAVENNGGNLVSTQILPVSDEGVFSKVAIRVQMTGDTEALQKTLYDLESARPLLFIDDLQVRGQPIRQRNPNNRNEITLRIQLTTQFELSGYIRRSEA